jgi:hypothetical protein
MLLSEAIVVIVLDRQAYRGLGVDGQRGRGPTAFLSVFVPAALFAFLGLAFFAAFLGLALLMPHMPQTLASSIVAVLAVSA